MPPTQTKIPLNKKLAFCLALGAGGGMRHHAATGGGGGEWVGQAVHVLEASGAATTGTSACSLIRGTDSGAPSVPKPNKTPHHQRKRVIPRPNPRSPLPASPATITTATRQHTFADLLHNGPSPNQR